MSGLISASRLAEWVDRSEAGWLSVTLLRTADPLAIIPTISGLTQWITPAMEGRQHRRQHQLPRQQLVLLPLRQPLKVPPRQRPLPQRKLLQRRQRKLRPRQLQRHSRQQRPLRKRLLLQRRKLLLLPR